MFFHIFCGLCISFSSSLEVMGWIIPLGEITPLDPIHRVGENLTLTCSLTHYSGPLNSSSLYFTSGRDGTASNSLISSQFYLIVSPTSMQLTIPFIKHEHPNLYKCFLNDTSQTYIDSMDVRVGSPPAVINEIEVLSRNLQDLNVTWCTKNIKQDIPAYHLTWTSTNWGVMDSCPQQKETQVGSRCYTCMWTEYDGFFAGIYHLVITGSSIFGNSTSNFTIDATEHVKPHPVSSLGIESLNSTCVRAKWTRPPNLSKLIRLNYTLTSMKNSHSPLKSVVVEESNSVVLSDFHPGDIYTFAIRCIPEIGGFFSDETKIDFKMPDDVPATAPEFPLGWFHSQWCMDGATTTPCSQNNTCLNVTFYWQAIPEHLRNGEILGYRLQYEDPNGNRNISVNSTSVQVLLILHKKHVLHLSAFTSAGSSVMRSIVFQSNCNGIPKPKELFAEQTSDKHGVIIHWDRVEDATNYSLLHCRGKDRSCFDEPMLEMIPPDQTNLTLPNTIEHIFALAVNTERGTSGLSWICLFDYDGHAVAPKSVNMEAMEAETVLIVTWDPVTCDELPNSGRRPGRVINYTVTYGLTGTNEEKSLVVPGNTTQCLIHDLSVGSNYTISVHGNTRNGRGRAKKDFHVLNPANQGGLYTVLLATVVPFAVIILGIFMSCRCYLWRRVRAYCPKQRPIQTPQTFLSSQSEYQTTENYTTSVDGYTKVAKAPMPPRFQDYKSRKESIEYKQQTQDTEERTSMLDINHNESSCFKAPDCSSYQSAKSSIIISSSSNPLEEELRGSTDVEALLCDSSETTGSIDSYYRSSEMGYASANMASPQVALSGPPQPVNYDSCFDDSSTSRLVGHESFPVEEELEENLNGSVYDVRKIREAESPSNTTEMTDDLSDSGDYSKASYAI